MTLYRCNAADRCGFDDCPHASDEHTKPMMWPDGHDCTEEDECIRFQRREGIGPVRSRCRCEKVQPCGHPTSAIRGDGTTHWCEMCEEAEADD